ncbi:CD44 antigen [Pelodytes ibericus]
MAKMLWILTIGLCSWMSFCQAQIAISCRFKGVFHVEKDGRYKLTREDATGVCQSLNCTLANMEQITLAHSVGFETCRYGFIEEHIVIPRITKNPICAANYTGIYILSSNITNHYDAYCFNETEPIDKDCSPVILPHETIFSYDDPAVTETINSDHITTTEYWQVVDRQVPQNPTSYENVPDASDPEEVTDRYIAYASTEQPEEFPIEHSGDHGILPDDQVPNQVSDDSDETVSPLDDLLIPRTTQSPYIGGSHGHGGGHGHHGGHHEDHADNDEDQQHNHDENEVVTDNYSNREGHIPNPTETAIGEDSEQGTDHDFTGYDDGSQGAGDRKKGGRRGNPAPMDSPDASPASNQPKQRRGSRVPDWLIVVVALVALGLILSVCIALNTRKLCGQKKKLVINGKKSSLEDGCMMEHNGDTLKSQEMVLLVAQDPSDPNDSTNHEDVRNAKDVDMKIGV